MTTNNCIWTHFPTDQHWTRYHVFTNFREGDIVSAAVKWTFHWHSFTGVLMDLKKARRVKIWNYSIGVSYWLRDVPVDYISLAINKKPWNYLDLILNQLSNLKACILFPCKDALILYFTALQQLTILVSLVTNLTGKRTE